MKKSVAYQGEPISFTIAIKDDESRYLPDISDRTFEALLYKGDGLVMKQWSTADNTMSASTTKIHRETVGLVSFGVTGDETANFEVGMYTVEIANVIDRGRAIGIEECSIEVRPARIKLGLR